MIIRNILELEVLDMQSRRRRLQCEQEDCFIKIKNSNQTTLI